MTSVNEEVCIVCYYCNEEVDKSALVNACQVFSLKLTSEFQKRKSLAFLYVQVGLVDRV